MIEQRGTPSPPHERMGDAFGRSARRSMRSTIVGVCGVFAISSAYFLYDRSQTFAAEQAWMGGLLIQREDSGQLASGIAHTMANHTAIVGVSVIGPHGQATLTVPESASNRAAAAKGLLANGVPIRAHIENAEGSATVWAIAVRTEKEGAARGQPLVMLLRPKPVLVPWLIANAVFAAAAWGCARLGVRWLTRWFHHRVAEPLQRFSQSLHSLDRPVANASRTEWYELAEVEAHFRELKESLAVAEERAHRAHRISKFEIESNQAKFNRKLRRESDKANVDALTGLRNRRFLEAELENIYAKAVSSGQDLSVVMIDLDNFKTLNDTAGHKAGDQLLRFVGELLRGTSRPEDFPARYGGDEFVVILPDTSGRHARLVTERLVKLFAQYASRDRQLSKVTMSAGVASIHATRAASGEDLMHQADEMLYAAKAGGKNAVAAA